jgi:hypothetical protein
MTNTPAPVVEESASYDNYLDTSNRIEDSYKTTLDKFVGEEINQALHDRTKASIQDKYADVYKVVYVHFRNVNDMADFCSKIGQVVDYKTKDTFFPLADPSTALFQEDQPTNITVDKKYLMPRKKSKSTTVLDVEVEESVVDVNAKWHEHWVDMPEFTQENNPPFRTVHMKFRNEADYKEFAKRIGQELTNKSKAIWHPKLDITANRLLRWVQDDEHTLPKYPMYIVSKGRHESMHTSRSLARMRIPHNIVIEPQDYENYDQALDNFGIRDMVTLLVAPFSNHGDGPGRARNWAWDHSISIGATSHWVLDDNISDFYRLHENMRIRFESGVGFRVMEDFVDRYDNVYISGPQYRFFIAPDQKYPPFVANTRIYSTLLIRNDCKHRWRGRYNEDTDICLRVLKDGDVCVQFNAFMQGKAATQTVKGGNTEEFYHAEHSEKINKEGYNTDGTINKSQMLADMHPDVARVVWRYGRWHHWVDYGPFKKNKLQYKKGLKVKSGVNNYGMRLETNFNG